MAPILQVGDLVRYHVQSDDLDAMGFKLGQVYKVLPGRGPLERAVEAVMGAVLIRPNGELTDWSDHFAKHRCPVILPKGIGNC